MSKTVFALAFMISVNVLLFLSQYGVDASASEMGVEGTKFSDYENSILSEFDEDNYTLTSDINDILPQDSGSAVSADSQGNIFTDTFSATKNWLVSNVPGATEIQYGYKIGKSLIFALPNAIKYAGLPAPISYAVGVLWFAVAAFLLVSWIKGNY